MSAPDDDTTNGQILRELAGMRRDLQAFSEQGESRHRALANDVLAISARVDRAVDLANEAKRVAERSAHDTLQMQTAVIEHTKGLASRTAAIESQNGKQTAALDALLAAETERKIREDERAKQEAAREKKEAARWTWISRAWPIGTAIIAIATYVIGHWKP